MIDNVIFADASHLIGNPVSPQEFVEFGNIKRSRRIETLLDFRKLVFFVKDERHGHVSPVDPVDHFQVVFLLTVESK